jgi:DNA-binding IclR family transcriptional regulator
MNPIRTSKGADGQVAGMQTLVRALQILRELSEHGTGLTLQELSDSLDIPLASVYRLLATMVAEGFVVRSPQDKRCFVGPAAQILGKAAQRDGKLLHLPPPALARVAVVAGGTAFLTELVSGHAICTAIAEGKRPVRLHARLGQEMPLHAAASARVLLVDYAADQLSMLLKASPMVAFQPGTPSSVEAVAERVRLLRARGYDMCEGELDRGVTAISIPVRGADGKVRQGITIAAAESRIRRPSTRDLVLSTLRDAAASLIAELVPAPGLAAGH